MRRRRPTSPHPRLCGAYDVGGDAFDYAVNANIAHLALFDTVGHGSAGGIRTVMLASLALAAYRNARRVGLDLTATYNHIDTAVRGHDRAGLITAVLAELDQHTGILQVISAGYPRRHRRTPPLHIWRT